MSAVEIILQACVAAGTLSAAILALWGDRIRAWLIRQGLAGPELDIEIVQPVGKLVPISQPFDFNIPRDLKAFLVHGKVVNRRKGVSAHNCRVSLKAISKIHADGSSSYSPTVPLQFKWSPAEFTPPDVDISDEQPFDFGMLHNPPPDGHHSFRPELYVIPNDFTGAVNKNESVRFFVQIHANNFPPDNRHVIEVAWDGHWEDDSAGMRNHLIVQKLHRP